MAIQEIKVPDLEGAENVGVVEIYVSVGEKIEVETPLISLESDKAVMDVPSPEAGTVKELKIGEGDTVNAGDIIILVETDTAEEIPPGEKKEEISPEDIPVEKAAEQSPEASEETGKESPVIEIHVPDLEGSVDVAVVEVYVSAGDIIEMESPLISLESDKAVMDVPSPLAGELIELKITEGDSVNTGDLIALVKTSSSKVESSSTPEKKASLQSVEKIEPSKAENPTSKEVSPAKQQPVNTQTAGARYHATPSLRSFARELGIDLVNIPGSGPKGRITREDVTGFVKSVVSGGTSTMGSRQAGSFELPPIASADYAAFGDVEIQELSRIKKISGPHLHRNWMGIPHVTQFEDADITALESFRKNLNTERSKGGESKISPLIFIIKAVSKALKAFPDFNSSLNSDAVNLTHKKYIHIGIAVDTPGGLVVPVIRNADTKGIIELAEELSDLSNRARTGKLKAGEMKGATFSISSLGGIGGTYFTPIVNAPEVAILGLSKSAMKPVWNGSEFEPRLILPFSISYDHRVIDGAQGARFAAYLSSLIADLRRALL